MNIDCENSNEYIRLFTNYGFNISNMMISDLTIEVGEEDEMNREYYKRINNLDIALKETNHKYIMIHQWAIDNSHKWGIASFRYNEDEDYWYLQTYGNFNSNVDWYDFGCLVQLGYKWIKDGCLYDNPELLGGE